MAVSGLEGLDLMVELGPAERVGFVVVELVLQLFEVANR